MTKSTVIIGGGFAGINVALEMRNYLPKQLERDLLRRKTDNSKAQAHIKCI